MKLQEYRHKLILDGKSENTIKAYIEDVADYIKQQKSLLDYLSWARVEYNWTARTESRKVISICLYLDFLGEKYDRPKVKKYAQLGKAKPIEVDCVDKMIYACGFGDYPIRDELIILFISKYFLSTSDICDIRMVEIEKYPDIIDKINSYIEKERPKVNNIFLFCGRNGTKLTREYIFMIIKRWAISCGYDDLNPEALKDWYIYKLLKQSKVLSKIIGLNAMSESRLAKIIKQIAYEQQESSNDN